MPSKIPKKNRNGDCFVVAGRYILDFKFMKEGGQYTLVHGVVTGQGAIRGIRFLHAWIENGDMVIDKSNGRDLNVPKALYYALGNINPEETVRYTMREAKLKMIETGIFGPWDIAEPPIEGL